MVDQTKTTNTISHKNVTFVVISQNVKTNYGHYLRKNIYLSRT